MRKVKKQSGFTLVEIAIVLVVIGLLLGGVLKGQELIESSRIKGMAKDLNGFSALITTYQDRYRGLPGDDSLATDTYTGRWGAGALTAFGATTGNNLLIGAPAALSSATALAGLAATTENYHAIQALRYAGFLQGSGTSGAAPANAAGGLIGFTNNVMGFGVAVNVVCFTGLSGKQAGAIDRLLDDGDNAKGSVRSDTETLVAWTADATPGTPSGAAVYKEATPGVIICKTL